MAGQLIRRGEQAWLVRVYLGRMADGRRRYHNKTVHGTKKQAQAYLSKTLHELSTGRPPEPTKLFLRDYLAQWLESTARPRVGPRTLQDYRALVARYILPALGNVRLMQLTPADVQAFYAGMSGGAGNMEKPGLSPRVVRYTHAILRSALKQAVRWNMIHRNPCDLVTLPKQVRRELHYLTPEQATQFIEEAKADRWYALWLVLLFGGLRPGEAAGLRWSDLDASSLRVQRTIMFGYKDTWQVQEPKTSRSRRTIPLGELVLRALKEHRKRQVEERLAVGQLYRDGGYIFADATGRPIDVRSLRLRHFRRMLTRMALRQEGHDPTPITRAGKSASDYERAQIERAKVETESLEKSGLAGLRLYDLRHSCASLLLVAGVNPKVVSERLGHASITLTMYTYSAVLPTMQEEATQKLERIVVGIQS
jgi:integrase